ncbi:MAG: DUF4091 domain-containing protein [Lentisphaerae bacterium]|nr:DUF4091 domain-containing protein [Lentisphaerota bacterium]
MIMKKLYYALLLSLNFVLLTAAEPAWYGHWWKVQDKNFKSSFSADPVKKTVTLEFPITEGQWDILRVNLNGGDWTDKAALEFDLKITTTNGKLPRRNLGFLAHSKGRETGEPYINAYILDKPQKIRVDLFKLKKEVLKNITGIAFFIWHRDFRQEGFVPGKDKVTFELSNFKLLSFDPVGEKVKRESKIVASAGEGVFWSSSGTDKVMPQASLPPQKAEEPLYVSLAGNEYEPFQVVYTPSEKLSVPQTLTYETGDLKDKSGNIFPKENISVRRVGFVPINQKNTVEYRRIPRCFRDKFKSLPGMWPDVLYNDCKLTVKNKENYPAYFTIHAPAGTVPGVYSGKITAKLDGRQVAEIPLEVEVFSFELPLKPSFKTLAQYSIAYGFDGHYPETYQNFNVHEAYYRSMAKHRISPMHLPPKGPPRPFDEKKIAPYIALGKELNFNAWLNFYWGPPVRSEKDRAWVKEVLDYLEKENILKQTYTYVCELDEVGDAKYKDVIRRFNAIHKADPRFNKVFLTLRSSPYLWGILDVWVPTYSGEDEDEDLLQSIKTVKNINPDAEMWNYGGPAYNIAQPGLIHRMIAWFDWKYQVDGRLYWCLNCWSKCDPYKGEAAGSVGGNRAGEGMLIYPPLEKDKLEIVDSIRYELLREGLEDYEYLKIWRDTCDKLFKTVSFSTSETERFELGNLCKRALELDKKINRKMLKSFHDYPTDSAYLYEVRNQLANQIMEIQKVLKSKNK